MKKIIPNLLSLFFFSIFLSSCSFFSSGTGGETEISEDFEQKDPGMNYDEAEGSPSQDDSFSEISENEQGSNIDTEESFAEENKVDEYNDDPYADEEGGNSQAELFNLPENPMTENQEQGLFAQENKDDSYYNQNEAYPIPAKDKPKLVPVKKMKASVYQIGGVNINRLYIVRPDDTMEFISMKIYGNDRSEELYSYNSHFRGKSLKVGDKIYYPSPINPDDPVMKTYYEDNNQQPQYYVTKEGDNLRKFSKDLLGHPRSWMEIYATNENIESKGRLPAGLQIRYWTESLNTKIADQSPAEPPPTPTSFDETSTDNQGQNLAMNENQKDTEQVSDGMGNPSENMDQSPDGMGNPSEENMDQNMAMNENQNTGQDQNNMDNSQENMDNPPPVIGDVNNNPDSDQSPPPVNDEPPVIEPVKSEPSPERPTPAKKKNTFTNFTKDEKLMAALSGLLLSVAAILWILIRRNRSRKVNFEHTHTNTKF